VILVRWSVRQSVGHYPRTVYSSRAVLAFADQLETSLYSAGYGGCKRDTVRISCCGAVAAAGRPAPATVDRHLPHAGRPAANPPHATAAVSRWDRQTDGRTYTRPLHRPCSACYTDTVTKNKRSKQFDKRPHRRVHKSLKRSQLENV